MTRILLAIIICVSVSARATTLDKPIYAEIFLRASNDKLAGNVTEWDNDGPVIHVGKEDRSVKWTDLTPASAFNLRSRLIDRKNANDWLALGEMAWQMGLKDQARGAFASATRLDPTIKPRVDEILAMQVASPTTKPVAARRSTSAPVKYVKSTPEQDAAAIAQAQKVAAELGQKMKINFKEVQTAHFIVFTDWDPREYEFLKKNVELAYGAVSRQFDIPVKENVFVGKLPVFMFARQRDFMKFANESDELAAAPQLLGYYAGHGDGSGHMAMWKPAQVIPGAEGKTPEEQWAYTLTHEFTHAFVDRYKSNRHIPRWLNEGLAEVIAQTQFPQPGRRIFAREMAGEGVEIGMIFDDDQMPGGQMYPVMQTMVEMLIQQDRKAFILFFDAIKDGEKPEAALKRIYGIDYAGLEKAWKKYAVRS